MALEHACQALRNDPFCESSSTTDDKIVFEPRRLAAFDNSDVANAVLAHNSPLTKLAFSSSSPDRTSKRARRENPLANSRRAVSIEGLDVQRLSRYDADVWLMSPPCQPHTRNNPNKKDDQDPRSKSFLHLCRVLRKMERDRLPSLILMENVVGFETSNCCRTWIETLTDCGYSSVDHFHLSPTQVGIPNDRPRYYCSATLSNQDIVDDPCDDDDEDPRNVASVDFPPSVSASIPDHREPDTSLLPTIATFLDEDLDPSSPLFDVSKRASLQVPPKVLQSDSSWCFDVVTPSDARSACFTQSYGKFVRGTGSVLYETDNEHKDGERAPFALVPPEQRSFDENWANGLDLEHRLRYFSGKEMARLMGFPVSSSSRKDETKVDDAETMRTFCFPPMTSVRQQRKLLGNSLNVRVAAKVAEHGLLALYRRKGVGARASGRT